VGVDDPRRAAVVDYWSAVEMFCPPDIPAVEDAKWVFRCDGVATPTAHATGTVIGFPQVAGEIGCRGSRQVFGEDQFHIALG
jgi:hypothetical protein